METYHIVILGVIALFAYCYFMGGGCGTGFSNQETEHMRGRSRGSSKGSGCTIKDRVCVSDINCCKGLTCKRAASWHLTGSCK